MSTTSDIKQILSYPPFVDSSTSTPGLLQASHQMRPQASYEKGVLLLDPQRAALRSQVCGEDLEVAYLLVTGTTISFLDPEGDGREALGFFGNTVPLLTVVLNGRVCPSGLAAREAEVEVRTFSITAVTNGPQNPSCTEPTCTCDFNSERQR